MSVAVIICGTNEKQWLQKSFQTIFESNYNKRLEVIYVDNHSNDGSVEFVQANFSSVHVLCNLRNEGFAKANNQGIEKAFELKVDYIFLVNPDTASPCSLIENCVQFMEINPDFGAIGPLQAVYGEDLNSRTPCLNEWSKQALLNGEQHLFYMDLPQYRLEEKPLLAFNKIDRVLEHAYIQGAAIFIRSGILSFPWFDETYETYYEEVDLCRRIRWLGYRIGLLTDLFIQHVGGGSTTNSYYKKRLMMRNKYYYILTDPVWKLRQIIPLLWGWAKYDFLYQFPKNLKLVIRNLFWLLFQIPQIFKKRKEYKKLARNRFLEMSVKNDL